MDGLVSKKRSEKGFSRALNDSAIKEIFNLKEKFTKLNATQIYFKLIKMASSQRLFVASVQRFVKNRISNLLGV